MTRGTQRLFNSGSALPGPPNTLYWTMMATVLQRRRNGSVTSDSTPRSDASLIAKTRPEFSILLVAHTVRNRLPQPFSELSAKQLANSSVSVDSGNRLLADTASELSSAIRTASAPAKTRTQAIREGLTGDVVVLALIGHSWASAVDAQGQRRLDDPPTGIASSSNKL